MTALIKAWDEDGRPNVICVRTRLSSWGTYKNLPYLQPVPPVALLGGLMESDCMRKLLKTGTSSAMKIQIGPTRLANFPVPEAAPLTPRNAPIVTVYLIFCVQC